MGLLFIPMTSQILYEYVLACLRAKAIPQRRVTLESAALPETTPLSEFGQGAKSACQTEEPDSIAASGAIAA